MKPNYLIILAFMFSVTSCSKFESEISLGDYRITYKVETESGNWFGKYIGPEGEVCLCDQPFQPSNWSYTFTSKEMPTQLQIEATSEFYDESRTADYPDVTISIYINGELKDIQTNSLDDGKSGASYPSEAVALDL